MKGIMSYFLGFIPFFSLRASESAIAIACLGFSTVGPCLLPLCSLPDLYSFITFFILLLALDAFFGCLSIAFTCFAWPFEHLLHIFFISSFMGVSLLGAGFVMGLSTAWRKRFCASSQRASLVGGTFCIPSS